jgi:hypothetical protein
MDLSIPKIRQLMTSVYDIAYFGSDEEKQEVIKEALGGFMSKETQEFRIYTVEELRTLSEGVIFEHSKRGRCWITSKADGVKCVAFQSGGVLKLVRNDDPWDQPMRMIYSEKG